MTGRYIVYGVYRSWAATEYREVVLAQCDEVPPELGLGKIVTVPVGNDISQYLSDNPSLLTRTHLLPSEIPGTRQAVVFRHCTTADDWYFKPEKREHTKPSHS